MTSKSFFIYRCKRCGKTLGVKGDRRSKKATKDIRSITCLECWYARKEDTT